MCSTTRTSNDAAVVDAGAADTAKFKIDTIAFPTNSGSCSTAPIRIDDWNEGPTAPYRTTSSTTDTTSDYVIYGNPGPDGQWRTAYDTVHARLISEAPAGLDGKWFTADDHIARTGVNNDPRWIANVSKTLSRTIQFNAPGFDETWFTDDDNVAMAQRSVDGYFGSWDRADISYRDIGPDHLLGTSDYTVNRYATAGGELHVSRTTTASEGSSDSTIQSR